MINIRYFFQSVGIIAIYYGIMLFHLGCKQKNDPNEMKFSLFNLACSIDTFANNNKTYTYKTDAYLVTGFQNTANHEAKIDSFVCSIQDSTWRWYSKYRILIYKESKYTNDENITKNPRDLYRYSLDNDFLFWYTWENGFFFSKVAIKGNKFYDDLICKKKR